MPTFFVRRPASPRPRRRFVPSKTPAAPVATPGTYYRNLLLRGSATMQYVLSEATAARRRVWLYLVDATDGLTPETGEAGGQPQLSKNGAAWGNTGATLTAVGNGTYYVELTAGELDTLGKGLVRYKSANTAEFSVPFDVVAPNVFDSVRMGLTALPNAAAEAAGGLYTRGTGAGQINQPGNGLVDVNVENWNTTAVPAEHTAGYPVVTIKDGTGTGEINTNAGAVALVDLVTTTTTATNVTTVNGLAANVVTAASIATGAIDADALASDAATEIRSLASGTSDSGTTTTMVDAARTEADDDYWKGSVIVFTSGTIAGQARLITGFTASSDTITFAPATTQAVSTQTYEIWPAGRADLGLIAGSAVSTSSAQLGVNVVNAAGTAWASGAITSGVFSAGAINNAAMSIDGSELTAIPWNASWDAEVQSEVDDALVAQRLDELLNADSDIDGAQPPTVGSVFHELMTKTTGAFTFDQTTDSLEAIRDRGDAAWITATGFSTHTAADVWAVATRVLTAATNITSTGGTITVSSGSVSVYDFTTAAKALLQTEAEDALVTHRLDELLNADSDIDGAAPPTVGSVFHELLTKTAGSFTFDQTTDSLEAIRDRGDAAWTTATGFSTLDAAGVRSAVGLASANLDTQLTAIDDYLDTEIAAIKAVTDQFTAAQAESTAVPAANATPLQKIAWLGTLARNKIEQTATTQTLYADNGSTTVSTSTHSDDGSVHTRGEWS